MAAATAIELSDGMTATSDAKADERALVIAAQRGSSEAFASLVRNYSSDRGIETNAHRELLVVRK